MSECGCCGYSGVNLPEYRKRLREAAGVTTFNATIARLQQKVVERDATIAEQDNLLASGIHTCSSSCKRPMCVMRRDLKQANATIERQGKLMDAVVESEMATRPNPETWIPEIVAIAAHRQEGEGDE